MTAANCIKDVLPRISIITPSFNQAEFLEECIDSILSQNYPNLEYIIMDGGSSDRSVEIIKKHEKYLTYWQSQSDDGQYAAINEGFKKTTGDVMAWLNSDDKYHDRSLFTVAYLFATHRELNWLVGRPTFWGKEGELTGICDILPTYYRSNFLDGNYNAPFIQQESTFWRRSLWAQAGGYLRSDLDYAGDLELWIRFFRFTELQTVDALLGGYRSHGNQKAVLAMDRYVSEAEEILSQENYRVNSEATPRLLPAPDPLRVFSGDMKAFFTNNLPVCNRVTPSAHQAYEILLKTMSQHDEAVSHSICLDQALRDRDATIASLRERVSKLEYLESSLSWRLTAPIRKVLDFFRSH